MVRRPPLPAGVDAVDTVEAGLVGACDGDLPLGTLVETVAGLLGLDGATVATELVERVRALALDGLLIATAGGTRLCLP